MQDNTLLTQYVQNGSEAAFSRLVARHLALVYATCLRETGSPTQAEDAAQVVFLLLARKAKSLHAAPSLAGWLYQTARFVAKDVRKQEVRRQQREQNIVQEITHRQETTTAPEWEQIEPLLNDALSALNPAEREAILLRFLEGRTLAETGTVLGLTEDAARMRVTRAVEKLRRYLTAHGTSVTGAALTALLTSEAVQPVPAHAAHAMTQGTLTAISIGPTPNVLLLSKGVSHTMTLIKIKYAALATCLLLAGAAVPPLVHALSPHPTSVKVLAAPLPLAENVTTKFTLDKDQHAYYSATLPKGASMIILDARWAEGKAGNMMFNLSINDKDAWLHGNTDSNGHYTMSATVGTEGRSIIPSNLQNLKPVIVGVRNEGKQCQYWLTILPISPSVSDAEVSPSLAVPHFGDTLPAPLALSEIKMGQLGKNRHAYFLISLKAGHYQSRLDFSTVSGKPTDLNGDLFLSDEKGIPLFNEKGIRLTPSEEGSFMTAAISKDVNELHSSESPDHDASPFTLKKSGVYLITIRNDGSTSSGTSADAVNFTEQIVPDNASVPTVKQN